MGVSLLAFFQWIFRYLARAARDAHGHARARDVLDRLCRDRGDGSAATVEPALEEAALDLGATEWHAFRLVTLPQLTRRS